MNKAKFIRKYYGRGYDRDSVYLVYEYRGHEYTVYENMAKGNVPLAWQHRDEQANIDNLIEEQSRPKKPYRYEDSWQAGVDAFYDALGEDSL